jgi:fused signal recognition particle receptor
MELKEIALQLAEQSAQMEQQALNAHRDALEKLAITQSQETERRAEEKKASDEANARAEKRAADKREAEAEQLRKEAEARRLIEQAADKQREDIEKAMYVKEGIARQMAEIEHAADVAARQIEDAKHRIVVAEVTPEHPLKRFLQTAPE